MHITTCIPCQYGHHDECGAGMSEPPEGMIGGTRCGCEGDCAERYARRSGASGVRPPEDPEGMREAVEAVAQALCAWPMVAVDDREHNTATHMATDAVKAMLPFLGGLPPNPNEDEIDAGIAALKRLEPDETSYRGIVEAVLRAVDARPSGAPGEQR